MPLAPKKGIDILVQPGASRNEVAGDQNGALVIRLTAPPVGEEANQALRELIAARLRVSVSRVTITRGEHTRRKVVVVRGVHPRTVRHQLTRG